MRPLKNSPDLWLDKLPKPNNAVHKYTRGHAKIIGALEKTGATRLAAESCARFSGLTSVIAPSNSGAIYRASLPAHIMVEDMRWAEREFVCAESTHKKNTRETIEHHFFDARVKALLMGPGGGDLSFFMQTAHGAWAHKNLNAMVLDAEAIKAWRCRFEGFNACKSIPTILTPHKGEFRSLFEKSEHEYVLEGHKSEQAIKAAKALHGIWVYKGPKTYIAQAGRECVVNDHASPYLATAGTGDVLAGMITGLCAAGMEPFWACAASVWIHGEAGIKLGPGLVASDISAILPEILRDFA